MTLRPRTVALGLAGAAYIALSQWLMTRTPPSPWGAVALLLPWLAAPGGASTVQTLTLQVHCAPQAYERLLTGLEAALQALPALHLELHAPSGLPAAHSARLARHFGARFVVRMA